MKSHLKLVPIILIKWRHSYMVLTLKRQNSKEPFHFDCTSSATIVVTLYLHPPVPKWFSSVLHSTTDTSKECLTCLHQVFPTSLDSVGQNKTCFRTSAHDLRQQHRGDYQSTRLTHALFWEFAQKCTRNFHPRRDINHHCRWVNLKSTSKSKGTVDIRSSYRLEYFPWFTAMIATSVN